jgi:hypothetical protein
MSCGNQSTYISLRTIDESGFMLLAVFSVDREVGLLSKKYKGGLEESVFS